MTKKDKKEFVNHLHGKRMKKYIILAAIIMAVAAAFWFQQKRINNLTVERDKYRSNTETLLQDVRTYQTKDSLNAAKVGNLELKLSEYKKYRADDAALIKSLQTKNRVAKGYDGANGNDKRITGKRPG